MMKFQHAETSSMLDNLTILQNHALVRKNPAMRQTK